WASWRALICWAKGDCDLFFPWASAVAVTDRLRPSASTTPADLSVDIAMLLCERDVLNEAAATIGRSTRHGGNGSGRPAFQSRSEQGSDALDSKGSNLFSLWLSGRFPVVEDGARAAEVRFVLGVEQGVAQVNQVEVAAVQQGPAQVGPAEVGLADFF